MKKILFLASALITLTAVQAQTAQKIERPVQAIQTTPSLDPLVVKQVEYDFGKIPQGKPVFYSFAITNTGMEPLKLDNVVASCGCTTPEWSKDPIRAGATNVIKVGYNAASEGYFDKTITIQYNQTQSKQIHIKGTVWKAPAGSAPANQSVQFLKQQIQ